MGGTRSPPFLQGLFSHSASRLGTAEFWWDFTEGPTCAHCSCAFWLCMTGICLSLSPDPYLRVFRSCLAFEVFGTGATVRSCPPTCLGCGGCRAAAVGTELAPVTASSLCWLGRVAAPEGREPHPLHHGPHRQVRDAAPAARATAARHHRQLPAEARGAARQQGERSPHLWGYLQLLAHLGEGAMALLHHDGAFQGTWGRAPVPTGSEHPSLCVTGQVAPTCPLSHPGPTLFSCRR